MGNNNQMDKIISSIKKIIPLVEKLKFLVNKEKIIIRKDFYYDIIIIVNEEKKVSISSKWKIGLIGEIVFKMHLSKMDYYYREVKKKLVNDGFIVDELYSIKLIH